MINLTGIPNDPGCYLFKDSKGTILYVGKSKSLSKRVKSYFSKKHADEKTSVMVSHARSLDFIVTKSEIEALILENNLIKKHQPKYNINLKDSKRYAYIQLTDETFPRVLLARTRKGDGKFFGPFTSAATRDLVIESMRKYFRLRTCNKMPKRACLRYHIGLCPAPCIGNISQEEYKKNVDIVQNILRGHDRQITPLLEKEMSKQSDLLNFERAMELRNQINAIGWLGEKQNMERQKRYDEDVVNYVIKDGIMHLILFNVYKGVLENKHEFEFAAGEEAFEEFLLQYYSSNAVPRELILPHRISPVLEEFLLDRRREKVRNSALTVNVPKIGEKKQLLDLVLVNVNATFFGMDESLIDLQRRLRLQDAPKVIECFDISHLGGTSTSASMVQFRNGRPDKNNYRRFKIRSVEGIDDFKAIAEVVRRRYTRLLNEGSPTPDLIVIDGGKGQLSSAFAELRVLGLKIPVISIAKKFEEIYVPGLKIPLRIDHKTKTIKLLQQIRDEAHRFAIKYNRVLRSKSLREDT